MIKQWLRFVCWFNRKAKNFSIRLVKWTGKSKEYIHPKHLIDDSSHYWFVQFLKPSDIVLDLGCGHGLHGLKAAGVVRSVTGLDHNAQNLDVAKRLSIQRGLTNTDFRMASLEQPIAMENASFSVILALDILEHLNNRNQFLQETYRILKPGGKLLISIPNRDTRWKQSLAAHHLFFYSDLDHKYEYTHPEIEILLQEAGYCIQSLEPTVYDTPWVGLIDVIGGISLPIYRSLSNWKREKALKEPSQATGFRIVAQK